MEIIQTEAEYEQALARVEKLMDSAPGSKDEKELETLAIMIDEYEDEHFPM
jgi:HTH-type transcriptional regulator/antitoxin HigA